jgi:hypothetical protein
MRALPPSWPQALDRACALLPQQLQHTPTHAAAVAHPSLTDRPVHDSPALPGTTSACATPVQPQQLAPNPAGLLPQHVLGAADGMALACCMLCTQGTAHRSMHPQQPRQPTADWFNARHSCAANAASGCQTGKPSTPPPHQLPHATGGHHTNPTRLCVPVTPTPDHAACGGTQHTQHTPPHSICWYTVTGTSARSGGTRK